MYCDNSHHLLKYLLVFACALSNTCISNLLQNGHFPILVAIFVTIATVKVKSTPDFYTWAIVLMNYSEETSEKQLLFFGLIGGPK